jgi:hypothetical protein
MGADKTPYEEVMESLDELERLENLLRIVQSVKKPEEETDG